VVTPAMASVRRLVVAWADAMICSRFKMTETRELGAQASCLPQR